MAPDDHHHAHFDTDEAAAKAELEGEVLAGFVTAAGNRLAEIAERRSRAVQRIVDLGCGPAVGSGQLAEAFPAAHVVAVDGSAAMVARGAARLARLGLDDRVAVRRVDLPDDLDAALASRPDLVWASMVLHHLGDEGAALARIKAALAPGALLALLERGGPVRVLPPGDDLDRPGVWDRLDVAWATWFAEMRAGLAGAVPSTDYPTMLARAGFDMVVEEALTVTVPAPVSADARRFAHRQLTGAVRALEGHADPADLAVLATLTDEASPHSVRWRDDVTIAATRHLYIATA